MRKPSALPFNEYQSKLADYLRNFCHRDEKAGWKVDKRVRDTGPWIGTYANGRWEGNYYGTHAPALIWYSPDMYAWLKVNRPSEGTHPPGEAQPVPDGAIIVKEMYQAPAAGCARVDPVYLRPGKEGAAIMVRDSGASHDGWFWGWFGWSDWQPEWPQRAQKHEYPFMGFGQYCTNCHASAKDNQTFSSLKNIKGEDGEPLVFLSQNYFLDPSWQSLQSRIAQAEAKAAPRPAEGRYGPDFNRTFSWWGGAPDRECDRQDALGVLRPGLGESSEPPTAASQFVTSDQCLGCHSAGGTGLQYDMTEPGGPDNKLINISPYGTWSGSPMGLAGRDPVFFAQLASETETFHPSAAPMIHDTCLGCHGVQGQRQFAIDRHAATGACETIDREMVNAVPYPPSDPVSRLANYGALARDGVSCATCHRMVVGKADDRQASARAAERVRGGAAGGAQSRAHRLCQDFHRKLLRRATRPVLRTVPGSQEEEHACGDRQQPGPWSERFKLRDVRLVSHGASARCCIAAEKIGHVYEQTTYPEWAFSDYRTGTSPDGALPLRGWHPGAVLPGLPHAQQGRARKSIPQQDRGDPGVHEFSAGRAHARCRRRSICPSARASPRIRWSA